jgi:hypothetical protein
MLWAAVPETTVHKNRQPMLWEDEIGIAEYSRAATPSCNAMAPEYFDQRYFRGPVAHTANTRHDL